MGATSNIDDTDYQWDASYDVVVIGYGYAGAVTALEAADAGSSVLVVDSEANIMGKLGEFGQGIIRRKAEGILKDFGENLAKKVAR